MPKKFASLCCYTIIFILFALVFTACKTKTENAENNGNPRTTAISYLLKNKFDEAEAAFKKAIKIDPSNILNYIDLSLIYLNESNYDDAEKQVQDGLKIQPKNIDLKLILSEIYIQKGSRQDAKNELQDILKIEPKNVAAYYKLSKLAEANADDAEQKSNLLKVLDISSANIVVRLQLTELLAKENKADSALFYIQSIKKIMPDFSLVTDTIYKKITALLQSNHAPEAVYYIMRFDKLLEVTKDYANSLGDINRPALPAGYSEFTDSRFSEGDFQINKNVSLNDIKFTDATASLGLTIPGKLNAAHSVLALADDDGTGNMYIYTSFFTAGAASSKHYLFARDMGNFRDVSSSAGIDHEAEELDAAFADYDNDGYQDLFISTTKGIIVYKNQGDGTFKKIKKDIGLNNINDGNKILIADFDQDGDLDLYVACKGINKFFRNNNDGTFTEEAKMMNLASNPSGTKAMDFGDWDFDGDLDIATLLTDGSIQFFNNDRHSKFENITDSLKLQNTEYRGSAIAFGDYNNDGLPDLFVAGASGQNSFLLKNEGKSGYTVDPASKLFSNSLKDITVYDAAFIDFDNDGHEDILVAGVSANGNSAGVQLFHNDTTKGFSNVSNLLPSTMQAQHIAMADFNLDGDDDIFLSGPNGIYFLRNDGGSLNHNLQVQLTGLSYGNNKNNKLGIGAQVELKSGDLYQLKTVRRSLMNFGVGMRDSLDAVRVIWPNGTPQFISNPSQRQQLVEEEKLKGSCPFLFAWDGKKYEFIKDMMWRSALGMPLAVHGNDTAYAFSGPSKEYLLIPGEKLQPANGKYTIKITEELWEAVYFDKAALVAIDHPDSVNVFTDERFVAPPYPGEKVYATTNKYLPVTAVDGNGNNVLSKIQSYDFQYISNFPLGKFQGLAQDHDLILDLGNKAVSDNLYLFLRGWTFPTDASINTSIAQSDKYKQLPPSLQVMNKKGEWQTVINNIGFPMGKDKMVIVNLSGKFLTPNDRRIRIQTNMQIYWDEIFFTNNLVKAQVNTHNLTMINANLAYRGYSSTYRKGGPFGPHWFDYYNVSSGQKWRDLTGYYTRYGNVLPLLQQADDEYIIADGGDEITIDFDAQHLPALSKGWKRDFIIYSEGWVKDGDLNTAYGQTVEPLPFHNMPSYPYRGNITYPADAKHTQYQQQYNTRLINTDKFRSALSAKN